MMQMMVWMMTLRKLTPGSRSSHRSRRNTSFLQKIGRRILTFFELGIEVEEVIISDKVIEEICHFAREVHPKEFIALLKGKPKDRRLWVESLIFQPFSNTRRSSHIKLDLPLASRSVGSVHSHPGPSNRPSNQDLRFFNKRGGVNLIIKFPYNREDIRAYLPDGTEVPFRVAERNV